MTCAARQVDRPTGRLSRDRAARRRRGPGAAARRRAGYAAERQRPAAADTGAASMTRSFTVGTPR